MREFGSKIAKKIMTRHDLLKSVNSLNDVPHTPPIHRHELQGDRKGEFTVDVDRKSGDRLVFVPDYEQIPKKPDGGVDLTEIRAIEIISVGDYHKG